MDERRRVIQFFILFLAFGVLLMVIQVAYFGGITGFIVLSYANESDFSGGTYMNTVWNGSSIVLSGENLSGSYVSEVIDAGAPSTWNNLSWKGGLQTLESLFGVDGAGDVYESTNLGADWTQKVDNYGRTTATMDLFSDNDYLYILSSNGNEVWRSSNGGGSFVRIYSGFSGSTPFYGKADSGGNLYVVTSPGEFWTSNDDGLSWTYLSDFNAGTQNPKGMVIDSNDYIYVVDGTGDVYQSTDSGASWTKVNDGYGGSTGTDGMAIDSNDNLYISLNRVIYKSTDSGVSWNIVNGDFSGYSNDGCEIQGDNKGNLYALDCIGRIFKSDDSGVTWSEMGDLNGGASNDPKGVAVFVYGNGPRPITLNPTHAEDEFGGDITSLVDTPDGTDTWERVEVQTWDTTLSSGDVNSVIGHCYVLWIDAGADIGFQVSRDGGSSWDSEVCVQTALESTDFTCDLKANSGVDTAEEVNNLRMRCTQPTSGAGDYYSVDWAHVDVDYNYSVTSLAFEAKNCSSADCSDGNWQSPDIGNVNLQGRYFQYMVNFSSGSVGATPILESIDVDYTLLASAPVVDIVSPQEGGLFGSNESIGLGFGVVNSTSSLDSCWYTLDGGVTNTSVLGCANTTFDVSGDGSYTLWLYANESISGLTGGDNVNFSVLLGAPSLVLKSPFGVYLDYGTDVEFIYNATDIDLNSCELWGDFSGGFGRSRIDSGVVSGVLSSFFLNISDGNYKWNVYCNDTLGNGAFNGNKTFHVDTLSPNLTISEPSGSYSSLTDIPLSFDVVENNLNSCVYNVSFSGTGNIVIDNSFVPACSDITFDVDTESTYILRLRVNDSAGNFVSDSSTFIVEIPSGGGGGGGSGGGGGGGGGSRVFLPSESSEARLNLSELSGLNLARGEGDIISLEVVNSGDRFLNDCKLIATGAVAEWVANRQVESLSPGEKSEFIFNINVPLGVEAKDYSSNIIIDCAEVSASVPLSVSVVSGDFEIFILSSGRVGNKLRVTYSVEDFTGKDNEIVIDYSLINDENVRIYSGEERVFLDGGKKEEFILEFDLPKNSVGEFELVFEASDSRESRSAQQKIVLSSGGIAGFAFLSDANRRTLSIFGIFVLVLLGLYLVVKFLQKHGKRIMVKEGKDRHFIKIDLKE